MINHLAMGEKRESGAPDWWHQRSRNFCFTWNNFEGDAFSYFTNLFEENHVKYLVVGKEVGESGTPHLQGYLEFKSQRTGKQAIDILNPAHVEPRRGSAKQASLYCKKGEQTHEEWDRLAEKGPNFGLHANVLELGEISRQGHRSALEHLADMARAGASSEELVREHPAIYAQYGRGLEAIRMMQYEDRTDMPTVHWRWGDAGSGKTAGILEFHPTQEIYYKTGNPK